MFGNSNSRNRRSNNQQRSETEAAQSRDCYGMYDDIEFPSFVLRPSNNKKEDEEEEQRHVHEFEGSTKLAEEDEERHNHRFAGVTGEAIPCGNSHIHRIKTRTDFFDHFHFIVDETGPAISVGKCKHVHLTAGQTTLNDGHRHDYIFTTLIEAPLI